MKTIKRIITSPDTMMGHVKLKQPLPIRGLEQHSPFLLLHHLGPKDVLPGGENAMDIGGHPHRGFEPVSFIFSGSIHHKDSRGNDSVIDAGGVQWMTAGRGIVHSEGTGADFKEKGGKFEMIQLWINLPKALKMVEPRYQGFQKNEIPTFADQGGKVRINVIAGNYKGLQGPVESLTGITAITLELKAGGQASFDIPADQNVILYQLRGAGSVNDRLIGDTQLAVFENEGENIHITASDDSLLLLLAGSPIFEKMVSWGPYVMNSQTEIMEAMRDFQAGKMGMIV